MGDRYRLFSTLAETVPADTALYLGSYVDLAPSFVWPAATYVDVDKRAMQFFGDRGGTDELLAENGADPESRKARFIHADYTDDLDLAGSPFELLVSLYAGLVSAHCTQYLRVGGHLRVNPSHGDAAMASLDPRYRLAGVIVSRSGQYSVRTNDLDTYLIPKRDIDITVDLIHET